MVALNAVSFRSSTPSDQWMRNIRIPSNSLCSVSLYPVHVMCVRVLLKLPEKQREGISNPLVVHACCPLSNPRQMHALS